MARMIKNNGIAQTAPPERPSEGLVTAGGSTGAITRVISRRRSHRLQWRIFECVALIILDAWLISTAFNVALEFRKDLTHNELGFLTHFFNNLRLLILAQEPYNAGSFAGINDSLRWGIMIGAVVLFTIRGLYKIRLTGTWLQQVVNIITSSTIGVAILITYYFVYQPQGNSRLFVIFVWIAGMLLLCLGRLIVSGAMGILYRMGLGETRLLVVGSGRLGKMVMQHIAGNPNLGYNIVGFLHDMSETPGDFGRFKMLGTIDELGNVIRSMWVDEVIIALPAHMHQYAIRSVKLCERLGASFKLIPDLYEMNLSRIDMESIEGIPLIGIKQISLNSVQRLIVRAVDISVALLALLIGSPLWLAIALIIRLTSEGPIIYRSTRIGLKGREFTFYKFRSMYQDADQRLAHLLAQNEAQGAFFKMKEDPRITSIGKFLRKTSLDEIPNLFDVLKGDMSLVGPRPPLPREVEQYEEWQKGRLAIKPGMTGLWQVSGRSNLSFDEAVLMDLYYIENWSMRLYFQILLRTVPAVLFSRGAY